MTTYLKRNDNWPAIRGRAADQAGVLDLTQAESLKFLMRSTTNVISGVAVAIDPTQNPEGFNWMYTWDDDDLDVAGSYQVELEITWTSTPPSQIETIPSHGYGSIVIEADLG